MNENGNNVHENGGMNFHEGWVTFTLLLDGCTCYPSFCMRPTLVIFFHYSCDFHRKCWFTGWPLDGLRVMLSLDEIIGDVVMDSLMMLMVWLSWWCLSFHDNRLGCGVPMIMWMVHDDTFFPWWNALAPLSMFDIPFTSSFGWHHHESW